MGEQTKLPRRRFDRLFDSGTVVGAAALVLAALLTSFYVVLIVNIQDIDAKTEDLKEHPYAVTVAAGRVETLLVQARTLDNRLIFSQDQATIDSVSAEFEVIGRDIMRQLDIIENCSLNDLEKVRSLEARCDELLAQQQRLIDLSSGNADESKVSRFITESIDPLVNQMIADNAIIIEGASRSFDQLYDMVAATRTATVFTATVLMVATALALALFVMAINRKNRQQKILRENLRQALENAQDANEAKSRFLSNISHDIRTPLAAIIGLTDIAVDQVDDRERMAELLEKIKLSSRHLLNLVNGVLDMSKIENGRMEVECAPFDVGALVDALMPTVLPQAEAKSLSFVVDRCEVEEGEVLGDEARVSQVLINLLSNAVKYTEPGGHVRLSAVEQASGAFAVSQQHKAGEGLSLPGDALACLSPGDAPVRRTRVIRFIVEDDGIGMSPEFIDRMFAPFEREDGSSRLSAEGTGLGLSITKSLVDLMGGTIAVQSEQGRGSCMSVDLPFGACDDETTASDSAVDEGAGLEAGELDPRSVDGAWRHVHVLLVEDNEVVGEVAEYLIRRMGACVDRAWNGLEALNVIEAAAEGTYDLVFMDVQMPVMDGLEAVRTLVRKCAQSGRVRPPIIAMTANAYVEDRERALAAGMDDYVVKPIGENDLCQLFEAYVGSAGGHGRRQPGAKA